jgi:hypothetical protein
MMMPTCYGNVFWTKRATLYNIVAYRFVARQRPQNKQVQPLLYNRWINKWLFLSNGSVTCSLGNEHPHNNRRTVFSMWSEQRSYKEDNCGNPVNWELSSAWEAVKTEPKSVKLKNLHCQNLLPGNGWWRHSRLEKGLVGAVVICKVWRSAILL